MAAATIPNLLVVGSDYTAIGDGTNYHVPIFVYNLTAKRIEGHYLTVASGASGTLSMGAAPLGTAFNVYTNVIATLGFISGGLAVSLFNTDTMTTTGAAFSNSAANFAGALKHTPYATVTSLTDTNVTGATDAFIVPYTNTHFLVVTPQKCWRIRLSDGGIENSFAIDPSNATYSRLNTFAATASTMAPPMPMADGGVVVFCSQFRNAANSANVSINALIKFDPTTGTTSATNYTVPGSGLTLMPAAIIPMPDGTFYAHRSTEAARYNSSLVRTAVITGTSNQTWTYGSHADQQDRFWAMIRNGTTPYPATVTISSTTATEALYGVGSGQDTGNFANNYKHNIIASIDANVYLYRRATSDGTGASSARQILVRKKSDGTVATGFTDLSMIDFYSGNTITGTGFNDKTFARTAHGNMAEPTLYTVREVLGLMLAPGPVYKYWNGTTYDDAVLKVWNGTTYDTASVTVAP